MVIASLGVSLCQALDRVLKVTQLSIAWSRHEPIVPRITAIIWHHTPRRFIRA